MHSFYLLLISISLLVSCKKTNAFKSSTAISSVKNNPASIGIIGDTNDVTVQTQYGIVLMGGSTDVDEAFKWMIGKAEGGDVIILRAGGSTGYNPYIYDFGKVNSVETLLINSRELANNPQVASRIRQAEMVFIAGGDQSNYVNFWKKTPVEDAINYLINEKKIPIGGTSAGCAIMGGIAYSALYESATSLESLKNPYYKDITLEKDFIEDSLLKNTITDTHYNTRTRKGRHVAFLARIMKDWNINARGIGVEEKTAVCMDKNGICTVFGQNNAHFLIAQNSMPEKCESGQPLTWNHEKKAVKVYTIKGSNEGKPLFNIPDWKPVSEQKSNYWYVIDGTLFEE